eukprot:884155-Amphidinium_carterae.1
MQGLEQVSAQAVLSRIPCRIVVANAGDSRSLLFHVADDTIESTSDRNVTCENIEGARSQASLQVKSDEELTHMEYTSWLSVHGKRN